MEVWRVHRSLADKQVIGLESPFRKHVVCSLQVAPLPGMAQAILFEFIDIPQSRSGGALARYLAAIRKLETGPWVDSPLQWPMDHPLDGTGIRYPAPSTRHWRLETGDWMNPRIPLKPTLRSSISLCDPPLPLPLSSYLRYLVRPSTLSFLWSQVMLVVWACALASSIHVQPLVPVELRELEFCLRRWDFLRGTDDHPHHLPGVCWSRLSPQEGKIIIVQSFYRFLQPLRLLQPPFLLVPRTATPLIQVLDAAAAQLDKPTDSLAMK